MGYAERWNRQIERGFFLASETMQVLDISRATLTRWNRAGYLRPFKRGGMLIYRTADIERILTEDMGLVIDDRLVPAGCAPYRGQALLPQV